MYVQGCVAFGLLTTAKQFLGKPKPIRTVVQREQLLLRWKTTTTAFHRATHHRCFANMADDDDNNDQPSPNTAETYTTNQLDRQEAEKLQTRLRTNQPGTGLVTRKVDAVQIAKGKHKYVLIQAENNGKTEYFVTSRRGAHYHRNAAEPVIFELEAAGYYDIEVTGGGRIDLDEVNRTIAIFGFSYSFGLANHAISREVVLDDPRYKDFTVTISNEGY